jgi:hypothetical protein
LLVLVLVRVRVRVRVRVLVLVLVLVEVQRYLSCLLCLFASVQVQVWMPAQLVWMRQPRAWTTAQPV